ncbi:sigma-70 family RNA polymerase sigma factor [Marivirga sp. S37H4]|uniref:Sigma-70 family RNA polymerase sigma factor n=1 Tax=Marivirga aurantiaca TaxID=2802615 RepID=A0A934WZ59_9BACT|nr:sigma-70 family RNA polymerase sigma factor [Marivirga aurantiaca]MBK6265460.1 sigma-70 family RNA polymerase sigma factor [Marivirga aurantiaca]
MDDLIRYSESLMQEESEKELIAKAKENPRWFEPLYDKYYKQIFLFLYKRHLNKELTAEVCSTVFYKALTKINSYQDRGLPFSSWLYKIALNESNYFFRRKSAERTILLTEESISSVSNELPTTEENDNLPLLKAALTQLKPKELNLIELRFFNGFSFKEIGEILSITENNAKVRCYRILDKMRIKMDVK